MMRTFSLFKEIDINIYEWHSGLREYHKHNFFEILFIIEGEGYQIINKKTHNYQKNDVFLLLPGDEHGMDVTIKTQFCVLIFNKTYFSRSGRKDDLTNFDQIFRKIEFVLQNASFTEQPVFREEDDNAFAIQLIMLMIREHEHKMAFSDLIIQNGILQILCLIARKLRKDMSVTFLKKADTTISEIIFYIQDNIYEPAKLKVSNLSSKFLKSQNYLGAYFKAATGYSIKEYILNCKLHLIKQRLEYSNMKINEIAYEFEFTDENHLNKFLKKKLGMTATSYRNQRHV